MTCLPYRRNSSGVMCALMKSYWPKRSGTASGDRVPVARRAGVVGAAGVAVGGRAAPVAERAADLGGTPVGRGLVGGPGDVAVRPDQGRGRCGAARDRPVRPVGVAVL